VRQSCVRRFGSVAVVLIVAAFVFVARSADSQTIGSEPPASASPAAKYMFYLHGTWVEKKGQDTPHPRYYVTYEYDQILKTLAAKGFVVIGESRAKGTNSTDYGKKVAEQAKSLVGRGVPPGNITIAGHSKGAIITMAAANVLKNPKVNYGIFGGCLSADGKFGRAYKKFIATLDDRVMGRFLSLVDKEDDVAGSCTDTFRRFGEDNVTEQIFDTGDGHGLFYQPKDIWIAPLVAFAMGK